MSKRDLLLEQMRAQMAADGARKKKKFRPASGAGYVIDGNRDNAAADPQTLTGTARRASNMIARRKKRASAPFVIEGGVVLKNKRGTYKALDTARAGDPVTIVRVAPVDVSQPITLVDANDVFLTRAGVMQYLNISEQALHDNMRRGVLKPVRGASGERGRGRRGVSVRFRASDVEKLRRPPDALTRAEVAERIGKSERTVERYATIGKLKKYVAAIGVGAGGGRAYWLPNEVDAFLLANPKGGAQ